MGTPEVKKIKYHQLADILADSENVEFVRDIQSKEGKFIRALGVNVAEFDQKINQCILGTCTPRELIYAVLSKWHCRNGKAATIGVLCKVLKDTKFVTLAGTID